MSKVVFVSPVSPFPVDNGKKVVISGILEYLIERHGPENVTYVLLGSGGGDPDGEAPPNMPCECLTLEKPGVLRQARNVAGSFFPGRAKSLQELMLYSPGLGRRLGEIVASTDPELIVCDTFRAGQFFETAARSGGSHVLYMDDLFSVRYQKTIEVLERFPDVRPNLLGNFTRFVPSPLRPLVRAKPLQKRLLRLERRLVEKRERECVEWFDNNLLINAAEARLLQEKTGNHSVKPIKPLLKDVGAEMERRYPGRSGGGGEGSGPAFVFLGALNIPHNELSIAYFLRSQLDEVIERIPGARLRVIGGGGSEELERLAARYPGTVSVEGFVDDLDAALGAACAMIIPLLFGSGVKIKTLEALSRGLPVISTDFGVEGIPLEPGLDCLVENDLGQYPRLMSEVAEAGYNQRLSRRAREFYTGNYSKEKVFQEYDELFSVEGQGEG